MEEMMYGGCGSGKYYFYNDGMLTALDWCKY
jgi:hypothetical protein